MIPYKPPPHINPSIDVLRASYISLPKIIVALFRCFDPKTMSLTYVPRPTKYDQLVRILENAVLPLKEKSYPAEKIREKFFMEELVPRI